MTLIVPQKHYQRSCGLWSFSQSLVTILHPVFATALFALAGIEAVIYTDLLTFAIAFLSLCFMVPIPRITNEETEKKESMRESVKAGLKYLRENSLILVLILFLAGVNLVASAFDAVLPAYVLPRENGGEAVLGIVTSCAGLATLLGSVVTTLMPAPKNRVRVIYLTMLLSLGTENFLLAFGKVPVLWCLAQVIGWLPVPLMNANMDVIFRTTIPVKMQGRVYSCRNTLQFFTIPIGLLWGGWMVDRVCEPIMESVAVEGVMGVLFGTGKGAGAALMMFFLGVSGTLVCLVFGRILKKYTFREE